MDTWQATVGVVLLSAGAFGLGWLWGRYWTWEAARRAEWKGLRRLYKGDKR